MIRFVQGGADAESDVFRTWAHQRRVDGVVLLDLAEDDHRPAVLESLNMDFSVLGHYNGPKSLAKVMTAEADDARTVVEHIVERGYDGCIQLTGPEQFAHERSRLELLRSLCQEHGIPHVHASGPYTIDAGLAALEDPPTCSSAAGRQWSPRATCSRSARSAELCVGASRCPSSSAWSAGTTR